jgi:hypothetical protein
VFESAALQGTSTTGLKPGANFVSLTRPWKGRSSMMVYAFGVLRPTSCRVKPCQKERSFLTQKRCIIQKRVSARGKGHIHWARLEGLNWVPNANGPRRAHGTANLPAVNVLLPIGRWANDFSTLVLVD